MEMPVDGTAMDCSRYGTCSQGEHLVTINAIRDTPIRSLHSKQELLEQGDASEYVINRAYKSTISQQRIGQPSIPSCVSSDACSIAASRFSSSRSKAVVNALYL